ncbi:hypothetical protein BDQ94DRAFT_148604 [Aspergillus welwitschiae]|uniref:Uncharacterized protein n=1 Tax=Aspergillus welwitschiae TaxID=1341132 RepID=A0A3F3PUG3_9EURO|nr:hypothetical protein BDQ94DRAFT_148604 [Aspergillus welwitschiae]RDH30515.1 hypothetical protein BDQ94DRAFT_148604 [Aspergillus welwitschiae]
MALPSPSWIPSMVSDWLSQWSHVCFMSLQTIRLILYLFLDQGTYRPQVEEHLISNRSPVWICHSSVKSFTKTNRTRQHCIFFRLVHLFLLYSFDFSFLLEHSLFDTFWEAGLSPSYQSATLF